MPTIPTGRLELELRRLYLQWAHQLPRHRDDLPAYTAKFRRDSLALIERIGGRIAMMGAIADFPVPRWLDLSQHIGTIYDDLKQAAIAAGISIGMNPTDVARAMMRSGMDSSFYRLNRLARTETVSAYWKNAWNSSEGLDLVMVWGAESGPRTCQWCLDRDGMVMTSPELRDHPNGRCTPIPTLPSRVEYIGSVKADGTVFQDPNWDRTPKLTQGGNRGR